MGTATRTPLSHRDRAVLRAVAAGRCRASLDSPQTLLVDGLCLADQFTGARLAQAGLIVASATPTLPVELTDSGRAALEAA
jgi:hypothetical protein